MAEIVPIARQGELDLDPIVAERCEERLQLARTHMAAGFYHWLEAGKQFAEIKRDLSNRHWAPWLREHDVAVTTADVLVRIAERFNPILTPSVRIETLQLDFKALETLASPRTPAVAAKRAIDRTAAGQRGRSGSPQSARTGSCRRAVDKETATATLITTA
jgi:hypothetical protein